MKKTHWVHIFLLILLIGCSNTSKLDSKETYSQVVISQPQASSPSILLYADNQQANVLSKPIFEQSKLTEKTVNTAHRYPALDAYALDLIDYINSNYETGLIIHAGDALNNSCFIEYELFEKRMTASNKEWYLSPGNHDGFYLGISSPNRWSKGYSLDNFLLDERAGWADVCSTYKDSQRLSLNERRKNIMDKYSFVQRYIETLNVKNYYISDGWINSNNEQFKLYCSSGQVSERQFLEKVCWTNNVSIPRTSPGNYENISYDNGQVKERAAWQHFVLQLIKIPDSSPTAYVLVIDTASYDDNRAVNKDGELKLEGYGAADNAHFSERQHAAAMDLIRDHNYDIRVIVGHHPLEDLDLESIRRLVELKQALKIAESSAEQPLLYVSGDTHDGYDLFHSSFDPNHDAYSASSETLDQISSGETKLNIREANLGALIDAPIEYSTLKFDGNSRYQVNRFSLTPLSQKAENVDSPVSIKTSKYGYEKKYALMDNLWSTCTQAFDFTMSTDHSNPLNINSEYLFSNKLKVKQASAYMGIPYLINWRSRNKSLLAYKINRLRELANVHHLQALYSHNPDMFEEPEKDYVEKIDLAQSKLADLRENNFKSYFSSDNRLSETMIALEDLVAYQEKLLNKHKTDSAILYRRCSALYEAEREYHNGFI
ncbi:metallophosphoesterase [Photobacterium alginatilyticum]|uniref:metallophosphoesterase n=1 Tax=Photobacterium alginatilyticum TaxID=1775171 RepID=UPI0040680A41